MSYSEYLLVSPVDPLAPILPPRILVARLNQSAAMNLVYHEELMITIEILHPQPRTGTVEALAWSFIMPACILLLSTSLLDSSIGPGPLPFWWIPS